ncbi:hypothetical protein RN001_005987 [Aquatica leii]|uniref:FLYWCH-type domain-containing protein n=1 Tax=Aquatica leii TaxID=1421715 RepID=A0AAN7PDG2_9COLE|nr:hypothetical protein RN001_005987 [Aquatica leii]
MLALVLVFNIKRVVEVAQCVALSPKFMYNYYNNIPIINLIKDTEYILASHDAEGKETLRGKVVNVITNFVNNKTKNTLTPQDQFIKTLLDILLNFGSSTFFFIVFSFKCLDLSALPIQSQRNRAKFYNGGYFYVFDKLCADGETKFWQCEQRRQCKVRVHVQNGAVIKTLNVHTHDSSAGKAEADRAITAITKRNQRMLTKPQLGLPRSSSILRSYEKTGTKTTKRNTPGTCDSSNIENFLLSDSGPGPQRILIFGRQRNLNILENCDDFFVDATFKIAPNLFHQVYVILAKRYIWRCTSCFLCFIAQ